MKENLILQQMKNEISSSLKWTNELDVELKKSFEIMMNKNVVSFEALVMSIISDQKKWTPDMFEKYYTLLEVFNSHVKNILVGLANSSKGKFASKSRTKVFDFVGYKIGLPVSKKNKDNPIFFRLIDSDQSETDIFDLTQEGREFVAEFAEELKMLVNQSLEEGTYINVFDYFVAGLNEQGVFEVCNMPNGILMMSTHHDSIEE